MSSLDTAKEKAARAWIVTRLGSLPYGTVINPTPFYYSSAQDFITQNFNSQVSSINYDTFECNFVMLYFLRFQDSRTQGCDENPLSNVWYGLTIFKHFKDVRGDNTNSHDEIIDLILLVRTRLLENRDHPTIAGLSNTPLEATDNLRRDSICEFLKDVRGDYQNFKFSVEVV